VKICRERQSTLALIGGATIGSRMPEESAGIPLAEILRTANELVSSGLIKNYALGGALAAMRYVEPLATYDADIFFIPVTEDLSAGVHDLYEALRARGWDVEGDHLLLKDFPVQFLAAHGLTAEAVRKGKPWNIRAFALSSFGQNI